MRLHTPLCDLLGIEFPILQAAMGSNYGSTTTPALAAAVSNAGGLGSIGATSMQPGEIREAIHAIRAATDRPFAIGLTLPGHLDEVDMTRDELRAKLAAEHPEHWAFVQSLYERWGLDPSIKVGGSYALSPTLVAEQVEVVLSEQVPVMTLGLGGEQWVVDRAQAQGMTVVGLGGSPHHAERYKEMGVDVIVAQGYEAGGHVGTIANFPLIPQVVDVAGSIPVVAAGGMADGRGIAAALALGAMGVWLGTAFLFAAETNMPDDFRTQISAASTPDMVVSRCYSGKPSRIVNNEVVQAWTASGIVPLPMPQQLVLMSDFVAAAEAAGRYDLTNNPGGQIAGMLTEHEPASAIMSRLVAQTQQALATLRGVTEGAAA